MTYDQQIDEEVRQMHLALKRMREETRGNPAKARQWLIRIGILDKSGKRLAKRYRTPK